MQFPKWEPDAENSEHANVILNYKVLPCMEYQCGDCCNRHCFNYHQESEMRRPVVNSDGQVLYWDALCQFIERGQPCPYGYGCSFAHSEDERNYHPGQYKSYVSKQKDFASPWEASSKKDRRAGAHKYAYKPPSLPRQDSRPMDMAGMPAVCPIVPDREGNSLQPSTYKFRFCAYYPNVENCRRKEFCSFAHSREEIRAPLLSAKEESKRDLSNPFFTERFKIHWCPIGVQHDWQTCVYAHNYQDARRDPAIGYGPRPCPYWEKKDRAPSYEARCPHGFRCPYSHGAKEQLYHPGYFKTVVCWDYNQGTKGCPRGSLCAFYHKKKLQRKTLEDTTDYNNALSDENMSRLQQHFRNPPFFSGDDKDALAMGLGPRRRQQQPPQEANWVQPAPIQVGPVFVPQSGDQWVASPMGSPMGGPMSPEMGTPLIVSEQPNSSMMYLPQSPATPMAPMQGRGPMMQGGYGSPMQVGIMLPVFPALDQDSPHNRQPGGFSPMAREFHPEGQQFGMFNLVPVDAIPGPPPLNLPTLSDQQVGSMEEKHAEAVRRAEKKNRDDGALIKNFDAPTKLRTVQSMSTADGSNPSDSDTDPKREGLGLEPGVPFFVDEME